jgi:hypothetical protein
MSGNEELKQKIVEWFKKTSREGKTKFYLKDVVKAFTDEYEKRDIQRAASDCVADGTLMYFSTGSTTMLVLTENFPKSVI